MEKKKILLIPKIETSQTVFRKTKNQRKKWEKNGKETKQTAAPAAFFDALDA